MLSKNIAQAIEIVAGFSNERFPVDLMLICKELDIRLIDDKPLDKDGYLICRNGKKLIFVNSQINNKHRRNFIIAHELGHFLLHRDQLYSCDAISESTTQFVNNVLQEREANAFASELLIPHDELIKYLPIGAIDFATVYKIAEVFDVSVTHAAMQAVQASNAESEILICYDRQKRKWYTTADKYISSSMVPFQCPVYLPSAEPKMDITGAWNKLYHGAVHQEIFCPYGNQYLVLLSGNRL